MENKKKYQEIRIDVYNCPCEDIVTASDNGFNEENENDNMFDFG